MTRKELIDYITNNKGYHHTSTKWETTVSTFYRYTDKNGAKFIKWCEEHGAINYGVNCVGFTCLKVEDKAHPYDNTKNFTIFVR